MYLIPILLMFIALTGKHLTFSASSVDVDLIRNFSKRKAMTVG